MYYFVHYQQMKSEMKNPICLLLLILIISGCSQKPFEGKISYNAEFETGLSEDFSIIDNIIGQAANSVIDFYIKEDKAMMITEPSNKIFGSFRGSFTKIIYDLNNQNIYVINDKDKTYMLQSLLEGDIKGFSFKLMPSQLDSLKLKLVASSKQRKIANYPCHDYVLKGDYFDCNVGMSEDLLERMRPTIVKIEGMENYDFSGLGFPLYFENKLFGKIGMTVKASAVEMKKLDDSIFSIDGYREISTLEFYRENIENIDFEAFGLANEFEEIKEGIDSVSNQIISGVHEMVDSVLIDIEADGIMEGINGLMDVFMDDEDQN